MRGLFATTLVLALLLAGPALAQAPAGQGSTIGTTAPSAATAADRDRAPATWAAAAPTANVFPLAADVEKFIGKDVYGMQGSEMEGAAHR
jgi:hypothetical protein